MADRGKVIRGLECCITCDPDGSRECKKCPYRRKGITNEPCFNALHADALALLKDLDKENKALRKLLDWAVECDFGLDNLGDWWRERFENEIKGMGYTESLIHLARRYIEVFEGGDDDAE